MEPIESGDQTVPVFSEEASAGTRKVATGRVRVTKTNLPHDEVIQQELKSEHVEIRRVQINKPVDGPQAVRESGDTLIVPIVEEVLQVQKVWMLKEELHIKRTSSTELHEERVVLNSERAEVERLDAAGNVVEKVKEAETATTASPVQDQDTVRRPLTSLSVPSILNPKETPARRERSILNRTPKNREK